MSVSQSKAAAAPKKVHDLLLSIDRMITQQMQDLRALRDEREQVDDELQEHHLEDWKEQVLMYRSRMIDNLLGIETARFRILQRRRQELRKLVHDEDDSTVELPASFLDEIMIELNNQQDICVMIEENESFGELISKIRKENELLKRESLQMQRLSPVYRSFKAYPSHRLIRSLLLKPDDREGAKLSAYINNYIKNYTTNHVPHPRQVITALSKRIAPMCKNTPIGEVENFLEMYIFPQIYKVCLHLVDHSDEDEQIQEQCLKYNNLRLCDLSSNPVIKDREEHFESAIERLQMLDHVCSPLEKMQVVAHAAESVFESVHRLDPKNRLGGDDFIDVWVFIVLRSTQSHLATTVGFIKEFTNPDSFTTELGYFFSTLEVAANFIHGLTDDKVIKLREAQKRV